MINIFHRIMIFLIHQANIGIFLQLMYSNVSTYIKNIHIKDKSYKDSFGKHLNQGDF